MIRLAIVLVLAAAVAFIGAVRYHYANAPRDVAGIAAPATPVAPQQSAQIPVTQPPAAPRVMEAGRKRVPGKRFGKL